MGKAFLEQSMAMSSKWSFEQFFMNKYLQKPSRDDIIFIKSREDLNNMKAIISNTLERKKTSNLNKDSVVSLLLAKYHFFDSEISSYIKKHSITLLCEKGCSNCCSDYFYFSMVEYFAIKHILLEKEIFESIQNRAKQQYKNFKENCVQEYAKLNSPSNFCDYYDDKKYVETFAPCVLLNENNECSCYQQRPFICRAYGTTFDQPLCEKIKKENNLAAHIITSKTSAVQANEGVNVFNYEGRDIITKPYPLIYWFSNDNDYREAYTVAVTKDEKMFIDYLAVRNNLAPISILTGK